MQSQQNYVTIFLLIIALVVISLISTISWLISASWLWLITLWSIVIPVVYFSFETIKNKLEKPYYHLLFQLDALLVNDYSLQHFKANSHHGIDNQVYNALSKLSQQLSDNYKNYNENNLLVNSLIQTLDSPVLLLNRDKQLIQGNQALSRWLKQDWRFQRLCKVDQLGLILVDNQWQINDPQLGSSYKIRSSDFTLANNKHQLLILTDISNELRKMQQHAWQQLIRVLSHEIKNSLTPIKSLAQTLAEFTSQKDQKDALNVIVERSKSLNDFVAKYAQISHAYQISKDIISLEEMFSHLVPLYPNIQFDLRLNQTTIFADNILLQQVLINLIENSQQAYLSMNTPSDEQCQLIIRSQMNDDHCLLTLEDNGMGIQNPSNLFVPFYTTKEAGSGIGLTLSRNIIEQHGGQLMLTNNSHAGAVASISLPF